MYLRVCATLHFNPQFKYHNKCFERAAQISLSPYSRNISQILHTYCKCVWLASARFSRENPLEQPSSRQWHHRVRVYSREGSLEMILKCLKLLCGWIFCRHLFVYTQTELRGNIGQHFVFHEHTETTYIIWALHNDQYVTHISDAL